MTELLEQKCVPCAGNLPTATEEEINTHKTQIPDWDIVTAFRGELRLQRIYQFSDFRQALAS